MTRDEVVRLMRQREEALSDRDVGALMASYADDCVVESPTHGPLTTRQAIEGVFTTWFEAFPDLTFRQDDLIVDGDRAAQFFTSSGTHDKPFGAVPPTGRQVEIRGVFLYTLRDGRIARETRYYDATALLVQIGVLKAKPV